eukprot:jgi/Botrbrau1/22685/Bobra.0132s0028.1
MMGPMFMLAMNLPLPDWMLPGYGKYREGCVLLRGTAERVIQQKLEAGLGEKDSDLLAYMLRQQAAGSSVLTHKQIVDDFMGLMFAGQDTTAVTLSFLFYSLAQHPAWQQAVAEEVKAVLGDKPATSITADDLKRMPKLTAVISETLRLYPAAAGFARYALEDCVLGKYKVPKGTRVVPSTYCLHRHPALWPRPLEWLPERWLPEGLKELGPSRADAFLPFSSGPRSCIGRNFAVLESQVVAAEVLRRVAFETVPGHVLNVVEPFTLGSSTGFWLRPRAL